MPDSVTVRDREGRAYDVSPDQLAAYQAQGFTPETDTQNVERVASDVQREEYGGAGGQASTAILGALSGATLGLSDVGLSAIGAGPMIQKLRQENPITSGVSEFAGALAPAVLSGGSATPAGMVSKLGQGVTRGLTREGAGLIERTAVHSAAAAAEGSLYGAGQYLSQVALEDKPISAEGFVGGMGRGALFAAPIGGGFSLAGEALLRARSLFPKSQITPEAAAAIKSDASAALHESIADADAMAQAARLKIAQADAQAGAAGARTQVTRAVFGGGDPAAIDAAAGANVNKEQLTAALSKLEASQVALKDWIAAGGDAELESALGGLQAPDVAPPGVPVGEFGAPGARGYKPGEVAAPGPPSQAPLENAAEGTPVTRMLRKGAPSIEDIGASPASGPSADIPSLSDIRPAGETPATAVGKRTPAEPTKAFDFKDSGLTFDPATRQYTTAEAGAGAPDDLMAALQGTHDQLASGKSMREVLGLPTAGGEPGFAPPRVDPNSEGFTPLRGNGQFRAMGDDEFEAYQKAYKQRLTPDERSDAQSYAGGGRFRELNGGARQGVVHASNVESAARLDELIAKSPLEHPIQVARVVGMENGGGEARKLWESLKPGDVVTDGGWQSTTTNFEYAHSLGDVMMIADVPKGYPAAPLPGPHNEWEMVLRRDTSYRVKSISEVDGKLYAHVEVLPVEGPPPPLKTLARGESTPKGPPVMVARAAEAAAPADDLLSQLQGTAAKLGEGKSIGEIGAESPARADYVSKKLAKREADASYFRAKATSARAADYQPVTERDYLTHRKSFEEKLSPDERRAIDTYTSSTYKDINRALRHGEIRNGREGFIAKIDDAVAKSPLHDNAKLYRGLSGDEAKQFRNLEVGDTFEEKAFTSTSSSPDAFKRDVNLHIDVPSGYPAAPVPSSIDEKEWLLRRNTRFEVTGVEDQGASRTINVRVVDSPPPRPLDEMISSRTGRQPDAPPISVIKRAQSAPDDGGDLLSALQGTNEGLSAGKSMRELSGAPMVSDQVGTRGAALEDIRPAAPESKSPSDTTRLREMIGGLGGGSDLPVSAAEYSARREAMGFASATAKKNIGRSADNDAIEALLQKRTGKNVDMAPALERAAKVIGDHEAASAEVADLLGADAPKTAVEKSQALAAARQAHAEAQGASAAKAAQGINDRGISGLGDQTVVEPGIRERMDALRGRGDKTVVDPTIGAALREQGPVGATAAAKAKGGLGGKLADVGTALEVMKALGVHVPALSAIPVIGPVLGLFLKARAVLGILGRKGGSVGRDVDGLIAAASAATRDRIAKATQAILTGAGKGALKISEAAAGPSVTLSYKLFPGDGVTKSKDPQKLYEARMDEIARAQQPNAIDHAIADRYQTSDPALHDAIVGQVQRGIAFLDSKAPKPSILQTMLPGDGVWKPSKAQLDEFGKYVHAVGDPASVLEDLAKGHVTLEGAETLRVVYPELFAEAQRMLMQSAPAMQKTLPYPTRVAISILYRVPVDNSMAPGHLQYLQAPTPGAQPAAPTGGPPPGAPMPPAITGPLQLGQSTMTALDRRAGA